MRALIAEDNSITRLLLQATLTESGYQVTAASDGAEAWQELQRDTTPELLLLDWNMPGMDGIEVCRKLRQLPDAGAIYVILVTAPRDRADIVAGLEAGANDYITKPFEPAELRARLHAGARLVELQKNLADQITSWKAPWPRSSNYTVCCRLHVLQKNPRRPQLLAASGGLYQLPFRSSVHAWHLP